MNQRRNHITRIPIPVSDPTVKDMVTGHLRALRAHQPAAQHVDTRVEIVIRSTFVLPAAADPAPHVNSGVGSVAEPREEDTA